jgi:imidazolonepropionase-like amidohydrolase
MAGRRASLIPAVLLLGCGCVLAAESDPFAGVPAGEESMHVFKTRYGFAPARAAPDRTEGKGPFDRLVIRGATLVDGTGAPPVGPVDIVVERDRIAEIRAVGFPGVPIREQRRPARGDHEIDAHGMYVLPGFVDAHAHIAHPLLALAGDVPPAEYVYKLWLGHGITTVREVGSGNGLRWTLDEKARSDAGRITAPRIVAYAMFPSASPAVRIHTPEEARAWVREVARAGADGIKFRGCPPAIMQAALAEAAAAGLPTAAHLEQLTVAATNVLHTSEWGLTSMEHWYGLPEAMFTDRTVQDFPADYNHNDEQERFRAAGRLWAQAAPPDSEQWALVRDTLLARDFTLVPTLSIYEASRDLMRAMRAEWHEEYTLPVLWQWFQPSREAHGSYWFSWTTGDEIAWKQNYALWMRFLDDYKDRGGRVAAGSDAGFIFSLFGFGYIRELELLQEAGFHPLEVIRSATLEGAEVARRARDIGSVEVGKLADLVIVDANPLENLKVLYGTGAFALDDETGKPTRVGGIRWTVKGGIVYDAPALLADVRAMVKASRAATP